MTDVASLKNRFERKPTVKAPVTTRNPPRATPAFYEQKRREQRRGGGGGGPKFNVKALGGNATRSTPAGFEQRQKEIAQRDKEQRTLARQQAARANLTLRAIEKNMRVPKSVRLPAALQCTVPVVEEAAPALAGVTEPEESGYASYGGYVQEEQDEAPTKEDNVAPIEFPAIDQALQQEEVDEQALDQAVIGSYLEANGRQAESVKLLQEYKGRENELMEQLLEEEKDKMENEQEVYYDARKSVRGYVTSVKQAGNNDDDDDEWN